MSALGVHVGEGVVSWTTDGVTWHTTAVELDGSVLLEGPGFRVRVTGLPLEADRPGYREEWAPSG